MTDPFLSRMAELDLVVEHCRGKGAFALGIVRDTSNRSNRDWPWWGIQIERTDDDGSERQRRAVEIRLFAPMGALSSRFEARWTARIWQGIGTDSFRESGSRQLPWDTPLAHELDAEMTALFAQADAAIAQAIANRRTSAAGAP
jgi:hypothetical protein